MNDQTRIPAGVIPATWLGRLVATLIAVGLAVIGLFFLAFALIAAALLATLMIARIWWIARKLRARRDAGVIEGSYVVEAESKPALQAGTVDSVAPPKTR